APVITRVELDHPRLDIGGLQRWMATRPKTPFEVPTLVDGIEVQQGEVIGDGYSFDALDATLPTLAAGKPAQLTARGNFIRGQARVHFDAALGVATAGLRSAFDLQAKTQVQQKPKPLKLDVDTKGRFAFDEGLTTLTLDSVAAQADSPLPSFKGRAFVANASQLAFNVDANLTRWPADWPTLPAPLVSNTNGLPVQLKYRGASDLSAPLALVVKRDATELDARVLLPDFMTWMDAEDAALLPPLTGTLRTPSLDFDGIVLQGVELEISADAPADIDAAPAAKASK
ncbi:MAG: hypothetical protein NT117_01585, partial [Gammaproteobacteria bacterium]|nr:hypothetical protein [Gammaproteobacteria bacterium]